MNHVNEEKNPKEYSVGIESDRLASVVVTGSRFGSEMKCAVALLIVALLSTTTAAPLWSKYECLHTNGNSTSIQLTLS